MQNFSEIKQQLLNACTDFVAAKFKTISDSIASNKSDLTSESKSSAGDKHETGRAMIQLEMEKSGQQLAEVSKMQETLKKVSIENSLENIGLGSLIKTTKGTYFVAISIGKVVLEKQDYFVISAQSPIGNQLLGKIVGDIIPFNNAEILEIC